VLLHLRASVGGFLPDTCCNSFYKRLLTGIHAKTPASLACTVDVGDLLYDSSKKILSYLLYSQRLLHYQIILYFRYVSFKGHSFSVLMGALNIIKKGLPTSIDFAKM